MNRHEPMRSGHGEAVLEFRPVEFRVVRPGAFVRCAVTGAVIPLEELRYWNVERQEAYASPDAVLRGLSIRRGSS